MSWSSPSSLGAFLLARSQCQSAAQGRVDLGDGGLPSRRFCRSTCVIYAPRNKSNSSASIGVGIRMHLTTTSSGKTCSLLSMTSRAGLWLVVTLYLHISIKTCQELNFILGITYLRFRMDDQTLFPVADILFQGLLLTHSISDNFIDCAIGWMFWGHVPFSPRKPRPIERQWLHRLYRGKIMGQTGLRSFTQLGPWTRTVFFYSISSSWYHGKHRISKIERSRP